MNPILKNLGNKQTNNIMTNNYTLKKRSLEDQVIKQIEEYITKNNLTYTANSPDFIRGLILGLDIGMQTMFYNLDNSEKEKLLNVNKIAEYLDNTNINETPALPNVDTNV